MQPPTKLRKTNSKAPQNPTFGTAMSNRQIENWRCDVPERITKGIIGEKISYINQLYKTKLFFAGSNRSV
jgi:hypothetical protein